MGIIWDARIATIEYQTTKATFWTIDVGLAKVCDEMDKAVLPYACGCASWWGLAGVRTSAPATLPSEHHKPLKEQVALPEAVELPQQQPDVLVDK